MTCTRTTFRFTDGTCTHHPDAKYDDEAPVHLLNAQTQTLD